MNVLARAAHRRRDADLILEELNLLNEWSKIGEAHLVGAVSYGLIVSPDIDIEIFSDTPRPSDALVFLSRIAKHPSVIELKYRDYLRSSFEGTYFKILFETYDQIIWNIDMWLFQSDRKGPLSRDLVKSMNASLTEKSRNLILSIKEDLEEKNLKYPSIFVYQAVMDRHVHSIGEFHEWIKKQEHTVLTNWRPH